MVKAYEGYMVGGTGDVYRHFLQSGPGQDDAHRHRRKGPESKRRQQRVVSDLERRLGLAALLAERVMTP